MGIGMGTGKSRAEDAAAAAISSPLLDSPIEKATGIVFNIVGGRDMSLVEVNKAAQVIYDAVDDDANIIFGALVDEAVDDDSITITVLATGFKMEGDKISSKYDRVASQGRGDEFPDFLAR